jgi:hypothetical protein
MPDQIPDRVHSYCATCCDDGDHVCPEAATERPEAVFHMIVVRLVLVAVLTVRLAAAPPAVFQPARDFGCTEWRDCRRMALAAAEGGDYETFHDLAWRAVQTGPPKDPTLMYLLARAQALSGRPHDALIMLQRLAEMGVPSDAATNDDFVRTRQLPGWPEVSAAIERLSRPEPPPPPAAAAVASSPPSRTAAPVAIPEGSRFSTEGFTLGGLAYDAVSRRFLFGDRFGRKLIVAGEGANHAVDFVRADSAGFRDIAALEIDGRRGDLWVISAAPADGAATLHKLQLVSGRPLKSFPLAVDLEPGTFVDLAVTPAGAVLVLDAPGTQVLALRPGGTAIERVMRVDAVEPASLTATADEGIAYLAHRDGVSRIDLRARTATRVAAPKSVLLDHLEQIRWRRRALIAMRIDTDGTRRIIRLDLNASGRAVTHAKTFEGLALPAGSQTFIASSGEELLYVVDGSKDADGRPLRGASGIADLVAYRVPLR